MSYTKPHGNSNLCSFSFKPILPADQGNGGTTGTTTSGTIVTAVPAIVFGVFTIASATAANPLPIKLIDFSGECQEGQIAFQWSTIVEINNDYFTIEHSSDGMNWMIIDTVQGAGNSTSNNSYSYNDTEQNSGTSIYRLKQTNFNGSYQYSEAIAIDPCKDAEEELTLYPNPSNGSFNYSFNGDSNDIKSIEIFNSLGEQVYKGGAHSIVTLSDVQAGMYFFHLNLYSRTVVKKIIITD